MKKQGDRNKSISGRAFVVMLLGGAAILVFAGLVFLFVRQKKEEAGILRFGMFAGSYWDVPTGNCYQVIDDAIRRFEADHPGIRVEYVSGILKEDYPEWLSEQVLLGKEPDVFMIPSGEFDILASLNVLKDLDGLIRSDEGFSPDAYYPAAYEYGSIGHKQYALPYECVPTLMFVNKSLLRKEGIPLPEEDWIWEDFMEICRQVTKDTDGDGVVDQFGFYDYGWQDAVYANGVALFEPNGSASHFGDPRVEAAVRFIKDLTLTNQGYTVTSREFDKGKVAFRPLAFSEYKTYKPYPWRIKKYSDFEWDCIKMPSGPDGGNHSELDTLLMGIGSRSEKEQLAWEFLKSLCYGEETQIQLISDSQGMPVIRKVARLPKMQEVLGSDAPGTGYVDMRVIGEVMDEAQAVPRFRLYTSAMAMADHEIGRMISGEETMDSGLLKLQREVNALLRQ